MVDIRAGRWTHRHSGELVVSLIGVTVNRPWRPDLWAPVFQAMPRMLIVLASDADSGLSGYRMTIGRGGPLLVQYWSSTEKLYAYASDREAEHRPAWAAFNRRAKRAPGAVGIWHETFVVDRAESIAVDSPVRGLAAATAAEPIDAATERARDRLGPRD